MLLFSFLLPYHSQGIILPIYVHSQSSCRHVLHHLIQNKICTYLSPHILLQVVSKCFFNSSLKFIQLMFLATFSLCSILISSDETTKLLLFTHVILSVGQLSQKIVAHSFLLLPLNKVSRSRGSQVSSLFPFLVIMLQKQLFCVSLTSLKRYSCEATHTF